MKKFEKIIGLPEGVSASMEGKMLALKCNSAENRKTFKAAGIRQDYYFRKQLNKKHCCCGKHP